jgi:hypothetical protein
MTTITIRFQFTAYSTSSAPLMSAAANLVYRVAADQQADDAPIESQERQQLRVMNLSLQDVPVTNGH